MMIRGSATMLFCGGVGLFIFSKLVPFLQFILMDWVAVFMMIGGVFILLFVFPLSGASLQYDTIPMGTAIVNYIRRDGIIVPLLGRRVFSGESFLDIPQLGIIEDLGKDTVFLWGRKKVRFGIENINYTPDPRYFNLCHELYDLGFDDSDDLYNVMDIPNMDAEKDQAKKVYYLERMANIYWNMTHQQPRGVDRLLTIFKKRRNNIVFGQRRHDRPGGRKATESVSHKKTSSVTTVDKDIEDIREAVDKWSK